MVHLPPKQRPLTYLLVLLFSLAGYQAEAQDELRREALELGDDYAARSNWEAALAEYEAAVTNAGDELTHRAYRKIGVAHLQRAKEYAAQEAYGPARVEADFALDLFQNYQPNWVPTAHNLRAGLALSAGDLFDALAAYNEGLASFHAAPAATLPRPHPDSLTADGLAEATLLLGGRAQLLANSDQALEALADYELLFLLQDRRNQQVAFTDGRTFLNLDVRPYYDRAIDLLVSYHTETGEEALLWDAFNLSERAKRQGLLTFLQNERAGRDAREAALRQRIEDLKRAEGPDKNQPDNLEAAQLQLDRLLNIRPKPRLTRPLPQLGPELFADLRDRDRVLAAFHFGREAGHLFFFSPDTPSIQHRPIDPRQPVAELAERFLKSVRVGKDRPEDQSYRTTGRELYKVLFGDLVVSDRGLIVVPDGPVQPVPFAALSAQNSTEDADFAGGAAGVIYLQRAGELLEEDAQNVDHYTVDLLAINPVADAAAVFPNHTLLTGTEADREQFLATAGGARIIELGVVSSRDAGELRFSDGTTPETNLTLADVATMDLRAELITLPNVYQPAESKIPISTALAAAGTRSSLTTLWPAPEPELLNEFYKGLADGVRRDAALAQAQASRRSNHHPYYWAGYQFYGAARTLVPAKVDRSQVGYWLGALGLLSVIGWAVKSRRSGTNGK